MRVSDTYYENEVRDGFFVPGMMKRAWAAQIEVLEEVALVCEKYNIKYFADAGTLLGAVRHGGFIPWDDDLDICMLREDYDCFIKTACAELPKEYRLLNIHTEPDYEEMFCRVVNDQRGISFEPEHLRKYHEFPFVAGIDIFPVDCIAPDMELERARCSMVKIVGSMIGEVSDNGLEDSRLRYLEREFGVRIDKTGSLKNQLYLLIERLYTMYNDWQGARELALMPIWVQYGSNKYMKEWYRDTLKLPFENIQIQVPAMYDAVLKEKYGEYMRIVRKGGCHDYPFYKKQEEVLLKATGVRLEPEYIFSAADLQREKPVKRTAAQAEEIIVLLKQAHDVLIKAIEDKDIPAAAELLERCQNSAIRIGTLLEESEGAECAAVRLLETYCELIYRIYEGLSGGDAIRLNEECREVLAAVSDSVRNDIKVRREVVFLPYTPSMWDSFEGLWKAAKADTACDVYVIPIPYYHKRWDGSLCDMIYEETGYPEEVSVVRYEDYDFAKRKPDVILIQNPYDEYDHEISVAPFFYSGNLLKFTSQLIYISDFVLDNNAMEEPRAAENMKRFITVPGVIRADKIIVKSEEMRRIYTGILTGFSGEAYERLWKEKVIALDSPVLDEIPEKRMQDLEIPEEWQRIIRKADGSRKKIIFYGTDVSVLLQYGGQMLEKMRNVFQLFRDFQNEVTLLWRPHPLSRKALKNKSLELLGEYEKLAEEISRSGWGIYDESAEAYRAVEVCDAYYGDRGRELLLCRQAGKPVMIQNPEMI